MTGQLALDDARQTGAILDLQSIDPAFGTLRRRGVIELVGYEPSTDPGTHGKPVARYRLVAS